MSEFQLLNFKSKQVRILNPDINSWHFLDFNFSIAKFQIGTCPDFISWLQILIYAWGLQTVSFFLSVYKWRLQYPVAPARKINQVKENPIKSQVSLSNLTSYLASYQLVVILWLSPLVEKGLKDLWIFRGPFKRILSNSKLRLFLRN